MLAHIRDRDSQSLTRPRPQAARFVGDCRHFAVLLCAILRHQCIPARARVGFATYLEPDVYMDHWLCEYWEEDSERWILVDADIGRYDVPRDAFLTAGAAWRMCRAEAADPGHFQLFPGAGGLWCVRDDLLHDLAALNKIECLSVDVWGLANRLQDEWLSGEELALLDRVAALASADRTSLPEVRSVYESDDRLRVAQEIRYYTFDPLGLASVDLGNEGLDLRDSQSEHG